MSHSVIVSYIAHILIILFFLKRPDQRLRLLSDDKPAFPAPITISRRVSHVINMGVEPRTSIYR